ncbi:UNVERIFIED_CONTAM: hypothetical protein PYX00_006238 [Menopon gallinae]|uniref:Ionotropic glutamate receptor C-terminal domain-containing protein n=1 Tax=Menopon gallinae TaxID=328185 RepID=A0AAW2HUB0_9NEOP
MLLPLLSLAILPGSALAENGTEAILRRVPPGIEGSDFFLTFLTGFLMYVPVPKTAYFIYANISERPVTYYNVNKMGILHVFFHQFTGHRLQPSKMDYPGIFYFVNQPIEETLILVEGIQFDRVIIGMPECDRLQHYFSVCIKFDMVYAVGICEFEKKVRVYTFAPFDGHTCHTPKTLILLAEVSMTDDRVQVYDKLKHSDYPDYKGCPINVTVLYRPPAVILDNEGLRGIDVYTLNSTLRNLNATLQYEIMHELLAQKVGIRADIHSNSQIVAGMLADFGTLYPGEEMINCGGTASVAMAAPKMHHSVDMSVSLHSIASSLPRTIWLLTLFALLANILVFYLVQNVPSSGVRIALLKAFGLANILVSEKFAMPRRLTNAAKVQFAFWCFFVFFINSFFNACMKSKLTVQDNANEIRDLHDVLRQNLKIVITKRNYETYVRNVIEPDPELAPLRDRVIHPDANNGIMRVLMRIAHRKDVIVIEKRDLLDYFMSDLDQTDLAGIHVVSKMGHTGSTFMYVRKQAPFLKTLRNKCMMLMENGLAKKIKQHYVRSSRRKIYMMRAKLEKSKEAVPLKKKDVYGAFIILIAGQMIAGIALLVEIFLRYVEEEFD